MIWLLTNTIFLLLTGLGAFSIRRVAFKPTEKLLASLVAGLAISAYYFFVVSQLFFLIFIRLLCLVCFR